MATAKKKSKKSASRKPKKKATATKRATKAATRKSPKKSTKTKPVAKTAARKRPLLKKRKSSTSTKRKTAATATRATTPKAVRLTFSYQGNQVKLVSQQPVDMTIPPSDELQGYAEHKGFWAELKNKQNKTVFRRVLHNPTRNDAEVFPDDSEHSISRQPTPDRKGVFVVVVPHTDAGHEVTLSRSTAQVSQPVAGMRASRLRSLASTPAKEFARFKLRK